MMSRSSVTAMPEIWTKYPSSTKNAARGVEEARVDPGQIRGSASRYARRMLLLVDLDGTVWHGTIPVPGVAAVLAERASRGDTVAYVTNNAMYHREAYLPRLAAVGAPFAIELIITTARATALYLASLRPAVERVLALGTDGLLRELRDVGLDAIAAGEAAARFRSGADPVEASRYPQAVVVSLDRELDYDRLVVSMASIRAGAIFIATNRDPVYQTERGLQPGAGAVVAALETMTGIAPFSIGKPEPHLLEAAVQAAGQTPGDAVMIGDSLWADIPAARAAGVRSILLLTGVSTADHLAAVAPGERPTAVARDADELAAALDALGG
jgi:4-nitrophenyl phosphatase